MVQWKYAVTICNGYILGGPEKANIVKEYTKLLFRVNIKKFYFKHINNEQTTVSVLHYSLRYKQICQK